MKDFMKLNHLLSIDGDDFILVDKVEYYEVYTQTNDDEILGGYLGDFKSEHEFGTPDFESELTAWLKGEDFSGDGAMLDTETIKWFKVKSSFYQQVFAIKRWKDVVEFVERHLGFDVNVKGQTTETFTGVDAEYKDGEFFEIPSDFI